MSLIRTAVATALAGAMATAAHAIDISKYSTNSATNVNVYVSGSTAVDPTLLNTEIAIAGPGGICQPGSIDVYQIGGGPTYRLTYCSATAGISNVTSGTPVAIFKESAVGSYNGAGPLVAYAQGGASGLTQISPSGLQSATDSACTTSSVAGTADFSTYTLHASCASTFTLTQTNVAPIGGVADVEAGLLHNPTTGAALTTAQQSFIAGAPGLDVVWGVAVTKNLFYALQVAEHLTDGTKISACNTANNDAPACAPTLTHNQVAALYSQQLFDWSQISGLNNTTANAGAGDNNVYICRRDDGSGTEASFETQWLGERCGLSDLQIPAEDDNLVFEAGGTGGVRSCLQALVSGGSIPPFVSGGVTKTFAAGYGAWGIGLMSTEVTSGNLSGAGDQIRMIAVDGSLPTLENTVNGFWPYFSTDAFYVIAKGTGLLASSDPRLGVFQAIQARIGHPSFTKISNTAFTGRPWGGGGDLAPAALFWLTNVPTIPATASTVATNPTNAYTKAASGAPNNCDPPVIYVNASGTGSNAATPPPTVLRGNGNVD
jgi:hypothetical protein